MNKIKKTAIITLMLKEARWIGKVGKEDWLEKIIEHTTPSGQRKKVKVKSLPPEEQEKYRPKDNKTKDDEIKENLKKKVEEKKKELTTKKPKEDITKKLEEKKKELTTKKPKEDITKKLEEKKKELTKTQVIPTPEENEKFVESIDKFVSERLKAEKFSNNDYSSVSTKSLNKNIENNLNRKDYDDKSVKLKEIKSNDNLNSKNWESKHKKDLSNNVNLVLKKYKKALAPDTQQHVSDEISRITDSVTKGINDGSLKNVNIGKLDSLIQDQVKGLIHQEIETRSRSLGDHGVRHILANSKNTHKILDELEKSGIKISGAERLASSIANINHDMGYTVGSSAFNIPSSKDHKFNSAYLFREDQKKYSDVFGKDTSDKIEKWIATHDEPKFDWKEDPIASSIRLSDSVSLFGEDKLQELFYRSGEATKILSKMRLANQFGQDVKPYKERLRKTVEKMDVDNTRKKEMTNSIDELTPGYGFDDVLSRYSGKLKGFKFNKDKSIVEVDMAQSPEHESIQKLFEVGQKQFKKLHKDFTETDKDGKPKGFAETIENDPNKVLYSDKDKKPTFQINMTGRDKNPINSTTNTALKEFLGKSVRDDLNVMKNNLYIPPELIKERIDQAKGFQVSGELTDSEKQSLNKIIENYKKVVEKRGLDKKQQHEWSDEDKKAYEGLQDKFKKFPLTEAEKKYLAEE